MECCCFTSNSQESFNHLFVICPDANYLWKLFAGAIGIQGPFILLSQTIFKWWKEDCVAKLKTLCRSIPCFIVWQLWKRRNMIKNGGRMSRITMVLEINRNVHCMAKTRYPWLANMPNNQPGIAQFLERYTPLISSTVVKWRCPDGVRYKCNSDDSSQLNRRVSSIAFCIRNSLRELVYARANKHDGFTTLEAEVKGFKGGFVYCLNHNLLPLIMETDSLIIKKILDGIWEVPWTVSVDNREIKEEMIKM